MADKDKTPTGATIPAEANAFQEAVRVGAGVPPEQTEDHAVTETVTSTPAVDNTAMPTGQRPALNQTAAGLAHRLTERLGERFAPGSVKVEANAEGTTINVSIYGRNGQPSTMGFGVTALRLTPDPLNTVIMAMATGFGNAVTDMMGDYDHNYEMSNAPVFDEAAMKARAVQAAAVLPKTQPEDRIERRANYTPQPPTNPPVPGVAPVEADAQVAMVRSTDVTAVDASAPIIADPRLAASVAAGLKQLIDQQAAKEATDAPARTREAQQEAASAPSGTTVEPASGGKETEARTRTRT